MKKQAVEEACRKAGMKPVLRTKILGAEVFIADGFSFTPEKVYARFGIEKNDFPLGCYATLWWIARDDDLDIGQPIFFDFLHDPSYDIPTKKIARVNTAVREATSFLKTRKKVRSDA